MRLAFNSPNKLNAHNTEKGDKDAHFFKEKIYGLQSEQFMPLLLQRTRVAISAHLIYCTQAL
jgi:hypothetical protein